MLADYTVLTTNTYYVILYKIVLYCTVYYIILYIIIYYIILYYIVILYYIILYYIILYIILYYIILYYIIYFILYNIIYSYLILYIILYIIYYINIISYYIIYISIPYVCPVSHDATACQDQAIPTSTTSRRLKSRAFWKSSLVASGNPCMMLCRMELAKSTGSCSCGLVGLAIHDAMGWREKLGLERCHIE